MFDDDAQALGIVWEESEIVEDENFTVFYDAKLAIEVFFAVQTQWLYSMDGVTGLNYSGVLAVIALYSKKRDRLNLLHEVSAIERGFLKAVNEKRNKK